MGHLAAKLESEDNGFHQLQYRIARSKDKRGRIDGRNSTDR